MSIPSLLFYHFLAIYSTICHPAFEREQSAARKGDLADKWLRKSKHTAHASASAFQGSGIFRLSWVLSKGNLCVGKWRVTFLKHHPFPYLVLTTGGEIRTCSFKTWRTYVLAVAPSPKFSILWPCQRATECLPKKYKVCMYSRLRLQGLTRLQDQFGWSRL